MAQKTEHISEVNKMMTAVEWFAEVTAQLGYVSFNVFEQAKQMEKEQIMTANIEGTEHGYKERTVFGLDARPYSKKRAEQYYNETFNK